MARRSDPMRVAQAQLSGAHMRLLDLVKRRDISDIDRARYIAETRERVTELEAELLALEPHQRN